MNFIRIPTFLVNIFHSPFGLCLFGLMSNSSRSPIFSCSSSSLLESVLLFFSRLLSWLSIADYYHYYNKFRICDYSNSSEEGIVRTHPLKNVFQIQHPYEAPLSSNIMILLLNLSPFVFVSSFKTFFSLFKNILHSMTFFRISFNCFILSILIMTSLSITTACSILPLLTVSEFPFHLSNIPNWYLFPSHMSLARFPMNIYSMLKSSISGAKGIRKFPNCVKIL